MTTNKLTRGDGSKSLDGQGNPVTLNLAYKFAFAWPGPDVTILIVRSINDDGSVNCIDVFFNVQISNINPRELFRPLRFPWTQDQIKTIKDLGGDE